jgi:beta-glucosidase
LSILLFILLAIAVLAVVYIGAVLWLRDPDINLHFDFNKLRKIPWKFGKGFLWGSATSSHQIEGHCTNSNWSQFESAVDALGKPKILNGQKAGICCDSWNLYKQDTQLMKELSLNSYRFSVEWSKIEPQQGVFDEAALEHYEKVVDDLLANGIEPMITLHHFTNPIWFEEKGAFLQDDSPQTFVKFAEKVVQRLAPKVKMWCTINEPAIYAVLGYFVAEFPPAVVDAKKMGIVYKNLLLAHTATYKMIKKTRPDSQAGMAVHVAICDPYSKWNVVDILISRILNRNLNELHLDYMVNGRFDFSMPGMASEKYSGGEKDCFDFVGLNYYRNQYRKFQPFGKDMFLEVTKSPKENLTDIGWEIYPEGIYRSLRMIKRYTSKPIYITENGIADEKDTKRAKYIEDHLVVINKAIADGYDIRGYYYWSLLDNFEWAHGFQGKFGLYSVDLNTRKRTLYQGSRKYQEIIGESKKDE